MSDDPQEIDELRREIAALMAQAAELNARVAEIESADVCRDAKMKDVKRRIDGMIAAWNRFRDRYG